MATMKSSRPTRLTRLVNIVLVAVAAVYLLAAEAPRRSILSWGHFLHLKWQLRVLHDELWTSALRLGDARAPAVVEFVDYACEICSAMHQRLQGLIETADLQIIVKYLPNGSASAYNFALNAYCGAEMGVGPSMHQALMNPNSQPPSELEDIERSPEFIACVHSERARAAIARDRVLASKLGVTGTPVFIADGTLVHGLVPTNLLLERLHGRGIGRYISRGNPATGRPKQTEGYTNSRQSDSTHLK